MIKTFRNFGNTCYLNSSLQLLCKSNKLSSLLKDRNDVYNIFNIDSTNLILFLKTLSKDIKHMHFLQQNDAHEFIILFLDFLHEKYKEKKTFSDVPKASAYNKMVNLCNKHWFSDYSKIMDIFYLQIIFQTECSECHYSCTNIENHSILSLELEEVVKLGSLNECLQIFFQQQVLDEWKCDKCSNTKNNYRDNKIWRLPSNLIICVKRNKYADGKLKKLNNLISVPNFLTLKPYTLKSYPKYDYNLLGVINHYGESDDGHYNFDFPFKNDLLKVDDDKVFKINEYDKQHCYIFIYEML
jgi:ubiquitin C-terminal hydrolase